MLRLDAAGIIALACFTSCLAMDSITDTLRNINQTQFVAVLEQAIDQGLVDLNTGGPYTILVPTNDAFNKLTPEDMTQVTSDATTLSNLVKYHILRGEDFSWALTQGRVIPTINGHYLRVYNRGQQIYMNNGQVVKTDVEATNAVLHLIDTVLDVPEGTIYAVTRNPQYPLSTFADYLDQVHLNRTMDHMSMREKYTVFAPSNDAFAKMPSVIMEKLKSTPYYLKELLLYHIHAGTLHMRSLDRNSTIPTMTSGHHITINVDTDIHLNHVAQLEQGDIDCDNGVVHVIDHVLIPALLGPIIG